ncbi:hypothetical protein BDW69DRAFT_181915 [Aspergillus filifer]
MKLANLVYHLGSSKRFRKWVTTIQLMTAQESQHLNLVLESKDEDAHRQCKIYTRCKAFHVLKTYLESANNKDMLTLRRLKNMLPVEAPRTQMAKTKARYVQQDMGVLIKQIPYPHTSHKKLAGLLHQLGTTHLFRDLASPSYDDHLLYGVSALAGRCSAQASAGELDMENYDRRLNGVAFQARLAALSFKDHDAQMETAMSALEIPWN